MSEPRSVKDIIGMDADMRTLISRKQKQQPLPTRVAREARLEVLQRIAAAFTDAGRKIPSAVFDEIVRLGGDPSMDPACSSPPPRV